MARYVMVGFNSDDEALRFLEHIHDLPEMGRKLTVARRSEKDPKKVRLTDFGVRTAYLRDVNRIDE
jgi:hypothetical protein